MILFHSFQETTPVTLSVNFPTVKPVVFLFFFFICWAQNHIQNDLWHVWIWFDYFPLYSFFQRHWNAKVNSVVFVLYSAFDLKPKHLWYPTKTKELTLQLEILLEGTVYILFFFSKKIHSEYQSCSLNGVLKLKTINTSSTCTVNLSVDTMCKISLLQLFQRCLMKVLHIDLWKCYLAYVRETKGKLPSYK